MQSSRLFIDNKVKSLKKEHTKYSKTQRHPYPRVALLPLQQKSLYAKNRFQSKDFYVISLPGTVKP